jgi:hypothetical protein
VVRDIVSERNFTYSPSVPASFLSQTTRYPELVLTLQDTNVSVLTRFIYFTHTENRRYSVDVSGLFDIFSSMYEVKFRRPIMRLEPPAGGIYTSNSGTLV